MARVAFYTYGVLSEPRAHPQNQGFWDRVDPLFAEAHAAPGFLALPAAVSLERQDDPSFVEPSFTPPGRDSAVTLSLWRDLESVFAYAYLSAHAEALRLRRAWFLRPEWPSYTIWWVGDEHEPTWGEAVERQLRLHQAGPTPFAFTFHSPFDAMGRPLARIQASLARADSAHPS